MLHSAIKRLRVLDINHSNSLVSRIRAAGLADNMNFFVYTHRLINKCKYLARLTAQPSIRLAYTLWSVACAGILLFMIVFSPSAEVYDETYHMGLTRLVQSTGLREALCSTQNQSAAGDRKSTRLNSSHSSVSRMPSSA